MTGIPEPGSLALLAPPPGAHQAGKERVADLLQRWLDLSELEGSQVGGRRARRLADVLGRGRSIMPAAALQRADRGARSVEREFVLTDTDFNAIIGVIRETSGIVLGDGKRDLVYGRLAPRLRLLGCRSFAEYLQRLEGPGGADEQTALVNAITTNLTGFFGEKHHFDALAADILPRLKMENPARRLRIWSAGCASGQEPYSIAMVLKRTLTDLASWDALVLATDIDNTMVARAEAGLYDVDAATGIPPDCERFLEGAAGGRIAMAASLKRLIRFSRLNLIGPWPVSGPFDVIFCRNVVIYFDDDTQRVLFDRFADILRPGGWLFIGQSESLHRVSDRFRHLGHTAYQKIR
jgi:chemotaxis protein methyltransferase CheR